MDKSKTQETGMQSSGFEMMRTLRQNAMEKAFEIAMLGQRRAEAQRNQDVEEGEKKLRDDHKKAMDKLDQDLNIENSKKINEAKLMKQR